MSFTDFSLFAQGGPMMWVLLVLGFLCLVLFVERVFYLHRGQIKAAEFLGGIKNILAKRRIVEALTVCEETPGPVAAVVKAALLHAEESAERLRFEVQEAAVIELPALERRLGSIAAIAQVAPLVGLLGTVLGMATTFHAFEHDYATASALSEGMWQALLCSVGGLLLAIPSHLAQHFLAGRVRAIVRDIEWAGNEIMRYLLTDYQKGGQPVGSRSSGSAAQDVGAQAAAPVSANGANAADAPETLSSLPSAASAARALTGSASVPPSSLPSDRASAVSEVAAAAAANEERREGREGAAS